MKKYFPVLSVLFVLFLSALIEPGDAVAVSGKKLRVAVVVGAKSVTLSNVDYSKSSDYSKMLKNAKAALNFSNTVDVNKDMLGRVGFTVNGVNTKVKNFRVYPKKNSFVKVDGNPYRGSFDVAIMKNQIYVINEVDMEDYLKGLLACEMEPESGLEALKAQAIVARTYALSNINKHKQLGFNLCNRTCCQVYKGVSHETAKTNEAVAKTSGMVVEYNKNLINAYYCSSCGGYTETAEAAWPGARSKQYLKVVRCLHCEKDKNVSWTYKISQKDFIDKMRVNGFNITRVISAKVDDASHSGRFFTVELNDASGPVFFSVDELRKLFGNGKIKSNYFAVSVEKPKTALEMINENARIDDIIRKKFFRDKRELENMSITFTGAGNGHGVGMCQNGAKKMADYGKSYKDIIRFYFTRDVNIKNIY